MIRKLLVLVIVCLISSVFIFIGQAQDDTIYGLVLDANTDVRIGPDFAYPLIDRLPRDASVEVIGRAGNFFRSWDGRQWLHVQYGDKSGWVLGRTIRMGRGFNDIVLTSLSLPRNRDGRVPPEFDLATNICDRWQGTFSQSGNFMAGETTMTVTYPAMPGTVNYSVVVIAPSGLRRTFDTPETTYTILLGALNFEPGVYRWDIIPYWNDTTNPQRAQQLCIARTGGTFEKPDTTPPTPTPWR